jgi:GTP cyclohydrolase I
VNSPKFAQKFAHHIGLAFGADAKVEEIRKPSGFRQEVITQFRVRVCSSYLAAVVEGFLGGDAHSKNFCFPEVVRHSRDTMQGFLDGYIEGDGCRAKSGKYYPGHFIISANRGFLERMSNLLDTPVGPAGLTTSNVYVSRRWFQERNTPKGFKRGFQPEAQEQTLEAVLSVVTTKVRRIQEIQREVGRYKPYTMYNFECAPHNSFLANGVLTHNCEHHLLPFIGTAHVGYIPEDNRVTGLSKIPRIVDMLARKPQMQERLTVEIADVLMESLRPQGVIVVIEAEHLCASMRGVQKPGTKMRTSVIRGIFRRRLASRDEALRLMGY